MKKMLCGLLFVTVGVLWFASRPAAQAQTPVPPPPQFAPATLYEGARLIVGDGSAPIENSAFIVDHGQFTRIGRKGEIQAPTGAARVDLTGKTIMPAMIDAHGHLGPTRQDYLDQLNLASYLGIAAATSMGRDTWEGFQVRAEAPPNAARLLACGRGMVGPLGLLPETIARGANGRLPEDLRIYEAQVATPEQARAHVRGLAQQRVDCIKIWATTRGGTEVMMAPAVYEALIDEAHRHNIQVFSDSWSYQEYRDLFLAGLDGAAHPVRDRDVDDAFVQILKDRPNTFIQTNLGTTELLTHTEDPEWLKDPLVLEIATPAQLKSWSAANRENGAMGQVRHEGWPTADIEYVKKRYGIMIRNTQKLYKAGIPFAVGPDGAPGFNFIVEVELLVKDIGLTPAQAITIATRDGARALRLDRYLGTVQSGKDASFVVLNANPLDDITNIRRIDQVYLRGHKVDRAGFLKDWRARKVSPSN